MMIPGEYYISEGTIQANEDMPTRTVEVENTGDRPIQVGSHVHFFEANKMLRFNRQESYGFRLDIPSGTSIRFEPGDSKTVPLVRYGGNMAVYGFGGLVNGSLEQRYEDAKKLATQRGYRGI